MNRLQSLVGLRNWSWSEQRKPGLDLRLSASVLACLSGLARAAVAEALIEQM